MRKSDCSFLQPQSKNWSIYKRKILFCEKGIDNFFCLRWFSQNLHRRFVFKQRRLVLLKSKVKAKMQPYPLRVCAVCDAYFPSFPHHSIN